MRMLRKSLEELDEKTIADALGMTSIKHRLNQTLLKKLDPAVQRGVRIWPAEFAGCQGTGPRQDRSPSGDYRLMESCNDYSVTFARGLVLKTPRPNVSKPTASRRLGLRLTNRRATC